MWTFCNLSSCPLIWFFFYTHQYNLFMLNLCHSILSTVKSLLRATMLRLCFIKLSTSFPFVYLCCLFEFSSFALIIFFWLVNLLYTQNIFSFFPVSSMASDSRPPPHPTLCSPLLHSVYWYHFYCFSGPMVSEFSPYSICFMVCCANISF